MSFLNSLQCEILKIKGSSLFWFSLLGSILLPMVFTFRFLYTNHCVDFWIEDVWQRLYMQNSRGFAGFLLPIGIIIICSVITQIEYKNNNWKQLHTTPQRFETIFFAKFTTLLLVTIFVYFCFNIGVLINGIAPNIIIKGAFPQESIPYSFMIKESIKSFVSVLPIIGIQYLLSLHFKNFIISIGAGLVLYVGTMPLSKVDFSFLSPYSYTLHYFDQNLREYHFQKAIIYFVVLFVTSLILYIKKKEKG